MPPLICEAVVVTCLDYRLQILLDEWLQKTLGHGNYDRVALAGGVLNWEVVLEQIKIAHRVHQIKKVILVNHQDCLAYGAESTPERHTSDLQRAGNELLQALPGVKVELYYLTLDGHFHKVTYEADAIRRAFGTN